MTHHDTNTSARPARRVTGPALLVTGAALLVAALTAPPLLAQAPAGGRQGGGAGAGAGQGGGRAGAPAAPQPPQSPQAGAPTDFTGWWVAVITEDWRFRMMTPPKGDFSSVPLNAEGQRVTREWDIAKDLARGEQCKAYGAANIMRMPTRLHITWQDAQTLKIETDAGTQTRLLRFDQEAARRLKAPTVPDWQGLSLAHWETNAEGQGQPPLAGGQAGGQNGLRPGLSGAMRVDTTRMRAGYLRRNGVPYSANAKMTEFFDGTSESNGDSWLTVLTIIEDPQYLNMPYMLSTHFKREADGSKFQPRPCELVPPTATLPQAAQ